MGEPATSGTGTGRRAGLDRGEVVARALAIVDEHGAAALSMRRLAGELGVTPTTIYWHVGGRDEVILACIRRVSDDLAARPVTGATAADRVVDVARSVWDSAFAHRNITALAHQIGATSLLELPLEVALATELEAAGLRGDALRDALRSILMCVAGFLVVALRPDDAVPPELRSTALWAALAHRDGRGPAARLHPDTLAALTRPADVEALFASTLRAVVEALVPAPTPSEAP